MKKYILFLLFIASIQSKSQSWAPAASPNPNDDVYAMVVFNNELYIGGAFNQVGGLVANHIAKWNGISWSAVGTGTVGYISALKVYNSDIYAAGHFTLIGGVSANNIAKWNTPVGINEITFNIIPPI